MGSNPSPALCSWVSKDESLHLSEPPFRHLQNKEKNHVHPPLHCHEDGRDPGKWEQTLKRCPGNRKNTLFSSVSFFLRLQVAEADAPLTAEVAKSGKFQTAYVLLGEKKKKKNPDWRVPAQIRGAEPARRRGPNIRLSEPEATLGFSLFPPGSVCETCFCRKGSTFSRRGCSAGAPLCWGSEQDGGTRSPPAPV